ncbi:hypothetical protein TNCV_1001271 [Trichonephila clavipes]|nr:hypothetical protein TNCV_1001271 [Trichonephila clavipes]
MTKPTPELAPPSSTFHTTVGGCLSLDIFNLHRPPLHGGSSAVRARTRDMLATSLLPLLLGYSKPHDRSREKNSNRKQESAKHSSQGFCYPNQLFNRVSE